MYGVCRSRDADAGRKGSLTGSRGSGRTECGGYWRLPRFEGGLAVHVVVRKCASRQDAVSREEDADEEERSEMYVASVYGSKPQLGGGSR
eukprot:COSAG01_NODE_1217_length_11190_cov_69.180417_13_plen_90_part_00